MIHLKIGNYTNKGDGLMLHAIIDRLGKNSDLTLSPLVAEYKKRATLGLYQTLWFESVNSTINQIFGQIPQSIRLKYGLVSESEIDAVVDASGFAYGDQWGDKKVKIMAEKFTRWKKQGKSIILLPQSFGSFEKPKVREHFLTMLEHVDLLYARDATSYEYVTSLNGPDERIKQAPDFTGALKGIDTGRYNPKPRQACIIPNHRMLDSTDDKVGPRYLPFLKECFDTFTEQEMNPFVLVHERVDYPIAEELQKMVGRPIDIVYDDDPLVLRGVISKCHIVISSRFHGLISTLSQGVPCLGTRWSHKFERVMEEYGCIDYLVSPLDSHEEIVEKIKALDTGQSRTKVVDGIKDTVQKHQKLNQQMWSEVEAKLNLV